MKVLPNDELVFVGLSPELTVDSYGVPSGRIENGSINWCLSGCCARLLPPSLARGEGPKGGGRKPRCVDFRWSKIGISAYRGQKCVFAVGEHIVEGSSAYSPRPSATPLVNEGGKWCAAFLTNTNLPFSVLQKSIFVTILLELRGEL